MTEMYTENNSHGFFKDIQMKSYYKGIAINI